MRVNPDDKIINREALEAAAQIKTDRITRIVALIVAFLSTYFFIIKILFL
jgi:hypothetical protein